jgi:hypothetical protein
MLMIVFRVPSSLEDRRNPSVLGELDWIPKRYRETLAALAGAGNGGEYGRELEAG